MKRLSSLWILSTVLNIYSSITSAEAIDRPNAQALSLPSYGSKQSSNEFVIPPLLPNSNTTSKALSHARRVFIKRIVLDGNSVFSEQELRLIVSPHEDHNVSIAELENLRQELTHYYIDRGYIDSGVLISTDNFKNGELHLRIIEGRIDEVRLKGLNGLREAYVKNRLVPNSDAPLNIKELQDRFQVLLTDPLIKQMNGRILAGTSTGHSVLDVDVVRAPSYHWSLFGNNYRPPSIGAEALGISGTVNNLTGLGDSVDFTFLHSSGSERYAGGFKLPLTDSGTIAIFHFDEGDSSLIEAPINNIDIKSNIHSLEGGISQSIINTLDKRLNVGLLLAVRENETHLLGRPFSFIGVQNGRNQATVWRIFQDFTQHWERHALAVRSTFSVGMDAFGATPKTQNQNPNSEFFAWLGQTQYAYLIDQSSGTQAVLRGNLQLSDAPLLPLEKMAVGGINTVRGYRENYFVRDQGYSVALELHVPLITGNSAPKHHLTFIPFVDYGQAWNYGERSADIYSIGAGIDWQYGFVDTEIFYGYALNHPLTRQTGDLQDAGLHFQMKIADAF